MSDRDIAFEAMRIVLEITKAHLTYGKITISDKDGVRPDIEEIMRFTGEVFWALDMANKATKDNPVPSVPTSTPIKESK